MCRCHFSRYRLRKLKDKDDAEYTEATPDVNGLQLELSGDATTEGVSSLYDADGIDEPSPRSDLGSRRDALTTPTDLAKARLRLKSLNEAVKKAVGTIVELVKTSGITEGAVRTYGPKDYGNATLRLRIKKLAVGKFGWLLDAKAKG